MEKDRFDLVEVIKANPGCVAIVDNDCWTLYKENPYEGPDDGSRWEKDNELCCDSNVIPRGQGYGSGCCNGADILQALAEIVGIKIESV